MKAPIKCPVCGDPLLNIFPPAEDLTTRFTKKCDRRVDHQIVMQVEDDEVTFLTILVSPKTMLKAGWSLTSKKFRVWRQQRNADSGIELPYFEPDLSDYNKLINKIKTYLVFS